MHCRSACSDCRCVETLRHYFSQFGDIVECMVMKDQATKRSRSVAVDILNLATGSGVVEGPRDAPRHGRRVVNTSSTLQTLEISR